MQRAYYGAAECARIRPVSLDDPDVVCSEYLRAERLETRMAIYGRAADAAMEAVAEARPAHVLDVGAGTGSFALRIAAETGAAVTAVDSGPSMVALARAAGVDASVADARALPLPDAAFDCVVANWMLYHVRDRDRAIAEVARVLRPGGVFVAATFSERNLDELWHALGDETPRGHGFTAENGAAQLRRRFRRVDQRPVVWQIDFADRGALEAVVAATIRRAHLSPRVAGIALPLAATARQAGFVATR
jgi:ubiquinone/menaquinone biosynthesis C-methylase UbiE